MAMNFGTKRLVSLGQAQLPEISGLLPVDGALDGGSAGVVGRQGERPRPETPVERLEMLGGRASGLLRVTAFVEGRGGSHPVGARRGWDELPDARGIGAGGRAWIHVAFDEGEIDEFLGQVIFPEDRAHHARVAARSPEGLGNDGRTVCLEVFEGKLDALVEHDWELGHGGAGRVWRRGSDPGGGFLCRRRRRGWFGSGQGFSGSEGDGRGQCRRTAGRLVRRQRSGASAALDLVLHGKMRGGAMRAADPERNQEEHPDRGSAANKLPRRRRVQMRLQSFVDLGGRHLREMGCQNCASGAHDYYMKRMRSG